MEVNLSENDILDSIVSKFLEATNKVASIFEKLGCKLILNDDFSKLLMHIYPGFLEHFKMLPNIS